MEKFNNIISVFIVVAGGYFAHLLGGWDALVKTIVALIVLDYITGVIKGIYTKTLSSGIGFKGILKKMMILLVIIMANVLQSFLGENVPLREIVITFFIANEGISLFENAAEVIPMPEKIKEILLQLRGEK